MNTAKHYIHNRPFLTPTPSGDLLVRQATTIGFILCKRGGVFDANYINSPFRRARVQDEGNIHPALTANGNEVVLYESIEEHTI